MSFQLAFFRQSKRHPSIAVTAASSTTSIRETSEPLASELQQRHLASGFQTASGPTPTLYLDVCGAGLAHGRAPPLMRRLRLGGGSAGLAHEALRLPWLHAEKWLLHPPGRSTVAKPWCITGRSSIPRVDGRLVSNCPSGIRCWFECGHVPGLLTWDSDGCPR